MGQLVHLKFMAADLIWRPDEPEVDVCMCNLNCGTATLGCFIQEDSVMTPMHHTAYSLLSCNLDLVC